MIQYQLKLKTIGFFNTQGVRRGNFVESLTDYRGTYYIPASHMKGVIRCEAERISAALNLPPSLVESIFGKEDQENQSYTEGKLKFSNLYLINPPSESSSKYGLLISRKTLSHTEKTLFEMEILPPNSVFEGKISIKGQLTQEEEKLLLGSILSASHYGLGSNRSRGLGACKITVKKLGEKKK
ncbi:MAG: RAMP superfamily CRISPR-associated protein [Candidatus Heimdallarchaeaceae archaeon]